MVATSPVQRLDHLQKAASDARLFIHGMERDAFERDQRTQYAVSHCIFIIGAAARHLLEEHPEFAAEHPELGWDEIRGIGDNLLADGADVDADSIWRIVERTIPKLLAQLSSIRHWQAEGE